MLLRTLIESSPAALSIAAMTPLGPAALKLLMLSSASLTSVSENSRQGPCVAGRSFVTYSFPTLIISSKCRFQMFFLSCRDMWSWAAETAGSHYVLLLSRPLFSYGEDPLVIRFFLCLLCCCTHGLLYSSFGVIVCLHITTSCLHVTYCCPFPPGVPLRLH